MISEDYKSNQSVLVPNAEEWNEIPIPRGMNLVLSRLVVQFYEKLRINESTHGVMLALMEFFNHDFESLMPADAVTDDQKMAWLLQMVGGKLKWVVQAFGFSDRVKYPLIEYLAFHIGRVSLSSSMVNAPDDIDYLFNTLRTRMAEEEQCRHQRVPAPQVPQVKAEPDADAKKTTQPRFAAIKTERSGGVCRQSSDVPLGKDRCLIPVFQFKTGPIEDRPKAAKFASLVGYKDPFRGSSDSRSIRKVLLELKLKAESNGLDALQYQYLLNLALTDNVKRAAKDEPCFTYEQLEEHLNRKVSQLIAVYGNSAEAEIVIIRRQFSGFRQKPGEKIADAGERFEAMLTDLTAAGIYEDPKQVLLQFIEGLNEQYRTLATAYFLNNTTDFFELRNKLIVAERMQSSRPDEQYGSHNGRQSGTYSGRATNPDGSSRSKQGASEEDSKGDTSKANLNGKIRKPGSCWSCGEKGHSRDKCPIPEEKRICTVCGKRGHLAAACLGKSQEAKKIEVDVLTTKVEEPSDMMEDAPPMLKCRIGESKPMEVLVDTGASCAIISSDFASQVAPIEKFPRQCGVHYRLKFANASFEDTNQSVSLPVEYNRKGKKVTKHINFLIARELRGRVILGRAALRVIGVQLTFGTSPDDSEGEVDTNAGEAEIPVDDPLRIPVEICFASAEHEFFVSEGDEFSKLYQSQSGSQLEDTTWSKDVHRRLVANPFEPRQTDKSPDAEEVERCAVHHLDSIAALGWIEFSNKYHIRLRRVASNTNLDTVRQKFLFEVSWTLTGDDPSKKPWNSFGLVKGLSPRHRDEWNDHVRGFTEKQWWIPSKEDTPLSATLFPVIAKDTKTTKCRPCCDMRSVNSVSPKVSARSSSVAESVLKLRSTLSKGATVAQYDLNKAFYRIHVIVSDSNGDDFQLILKVGATSYVSDRLVFGLAVGPSSLNTSQQITGQVVRQISNDLFRGIVAATVEVMDDFLFVGDESAVNTTAQLYQTVWALTGFDWKSFRWTSPEPALWLGQKWAFDPASEQLSMHRNNFESAVVKKWSKREVFRQAGKFAQITAGFREALARVHADALRQIAGQWPTWDEPCGDINVTKVLEHHLALAHNHWNRCCEDDNKLVLLGEARELRIETDASGRGYGFVVWTEKGILLAEGKLFGAGSESWHCNRRELFSLSQSILKSDTLLRFTPNVKSVVAFSDSKVAVSQADEWRNVTSKSLERKVLMRLRNAILEIKFLWKAAGISFRIEHIAGTKNELADELSRTAILRKEVSLIETQERVTACKPFLEWLRKRELFQAWHRKEQLPVIGDSEWRRFLKSSQELDGRCLAIRESLSQGKTDASTQGIVIKEDGLLVREFMGREQIWIPDYLLVELLSHMHKQMGHSALGPCLSNFFVAAFHPAARKILKQVIRSCEGCNISSSKRNGQASYGPVKMPSSPFQVIGVDLYGPLQRARGVDCCRYMCK